MANTLTIMLWLLNLLFICTSSSIGYLRFMASLGCICIIFRYMNI